MLSILHQRNYQSQKKLLLQKGPSFVPTPSDINWYEVRRDFDKFVSQLRYRVTHSTEMRSSPEILSEQPTAGNINVIPNPQRKKISNIYIIPLKTDKMQELRTFH